MARDHREVVEGGLKIKAMGNELLRAIGGRAIHPVNIRVGGFYKAPSKADLEALVPGLEEARELARKSVAWVAGLDFPDFEQDYEFVALRHPDRYAIEDGRLVSSSGLDIGPGEYEEHFVEEQVPHSTALQSRMSDGGTYFLGPMARYSLNSAQLSDVAREAAERGRPGGGVPQPIQVDHRPGGGDSLRLRRGAALDRGLRAARVARRRRCEPKAAAGTGWSEAPRGMLWHRYRLEDDGSIAEARIVPPTSQNQARIEQDLLEFVRPRVDLPDDRLQWECEQAIRNYDPCISCSTHFLKLDVRPRVEARSDDCTAPSSTDVRSRRTRRSCARSASSWNGSGACCTRWSESESNSTVTSSGRERWRRESGSESTASEIRREEPRLLSLIGIGNRFRRDDAAGLEVVRRLRWRHPPGCGADRGGGGAGLSDRGLEQRQGSARGRRGSSSGAEPGTLHRFDVTAAPLPG